MLMIFFKQGPFAQNGVVTFWMPVAVFFGWIITMSWAAARAANEPPASVDSTANPDHFLAPSKSSR
jgi:hypothetical protein